MSTFVPTRRTILSTAMAAPFISTCGRAQSLQRLDLPIDWKPAPTYAGFYIAQETDAFRRRGLDIRIVEGHGASASAQMIATGKEYWIGSSSAAATAIGRSHGFPIRSLAVYYRRTPTVLYSRAEDRIDAPRELVGRRVGLVAGSTTVDEYRALLAANGIDRSRIREVKVPWDPKPLLDRKVDALLDYEEIAPAELQAQGKHIAVMRVADFGVRLYSLNLLVNDDAWASPEKREIARRIAEAVREGYSLVNERPADAAMHFSRLFPRLDPRYVDHSMASVARQLSPAPVGGQTRQGWQETIDLLSSLNLLARPVTVDEVAILE